MNTTTTTTTANASAEVITRPYTTDQLTKRELVHYHRAQAAYDLAALLGEPVTVDEHDKAAELLNRCTRYTLANVRECERENVSERYARSHACTHNAELLGKRLAKLNKELGRYGVRLVSHGCGSSIIDAKGNEPCRLHYF